VSAVLLLFKQSAHYSHWSGRGDRQPGVGKLLRGNHLGKISGAMVRSYLETAKQVRTDLRVASTSPILTLFPAIDIPRANGASGFPNEHTGLIRTDHPGGSNILVHVLFPPELSGIGVPGVPRVPCCTAPQQPCDWQGQTSKE